MKKNVLYTTIYPGAEKYVPDWAASVLSQDTHDFDVYIGLDTVSRDLLPGAVTANFSVTFIEADMTETPIGLRNRAMALMSSAYDAVIFADSDDVLEPTRVSSALFALQTSDIHGCGLSLINGEGDDLGIYFGLVEDESPEEVLPRYNFLGLSNTAWRAPALQACLPAPLECIAMDWFLATCGWCRGFCISFDRTKRMRYRQYGTNIARVVPPFTSEQIIKATDIVSGHYRVLLGAKIAASGARRRLLEDAAARVNVFKANIVSSRMKLEAYMHALNQLPAHRLWWLTVAHPDLEDIWSC
jgi:hypothetical protein